VIPGAANALEERADDLVDLSLGDAPERRHGAAEAVRVLRPQARYGASRLVLADGSKQNRRLADACIVVGTARPGWARLGHSNVRLEQGFPRIKVQPADLSNASQYCRSPLARIRGLTRCAETDTEPTARGIPSPAGTAIALIQAEELAVAEMALDIAATTNTRYLTDPDEIFQVFKLLRDQRAELQLRFDKETAVHRAKVLDLRGTTLLIDDVQPRDGMRFLRTNHPFALASRVDGLYVHSAGNRVHKADSERSVPYFHVALPKSMLFQQRRNSTRVQLPLRVTTQGARVTLHPADKDAKPLVGTIIDISAGSCRAEFAGIRFRWIHDDDPLEQCELSIPNLLELTAKAVIRHSTLDARRNLLTCGIEFTEMHVTDRRRLEQFIQTIARISGSG
jgi:c-di-GMP-binding flagellar brake protein YcgR